jgi:hypothetical protein
MKISELVRKRIELFEEGKIIKFSDFNIDTGKELALGKALSREVKDKNLERLKKGVYYKVKKSKFGVLRTGEDEIIKSEIFKNNKQIGYITGTRLYNYMGLTTQLSTIIEIKLNTRRKIKLIDNRKIVYKYSKIKINKKNIKQLQILDCIQNINKIMDSDVVNNFFKLKKIIDKMPLKEKNLLIETSMDYLPKTRAILGMILDNDDSVKIKKLKENINNLSKYKVGLKSIINSKRWNII